jgi:hypothetical protein
MPEAVARRILLPNHRVTTKIWNLCKRNNCASNHCRFAYELQLAFPLGHRHIFFDSYEADLADHVSKYSPKFNFEGLEEVS